MNLEERLQNFYSLSVNDKRLGNDPLMREIYEVDDPTPPRLAADIHPGHPTFWKYRTRLTIEHVIRRFQDVRSNKDSCKILGKFLKEEHRLRAVRHLPDILALLRILNDRFHRRINRDEADKFKIREFLKELPKDKKESVTKLFESFLTAWDQVRFQLSSQGRFTPSQEQCSKSIDMTSTVSVLLPAEAGPGVCCKALLFFLVNTHNEMVETYHGAFGSDERTRTIAKIPFTEVSSSQLVAYDSEKYLLPVMLANCTYTLEVGKETSLQYNWEALQKQIVDNFIRGRPIVEFKLDDFVFHEDDRDMSFVKLREKIPQESIDGNTRIQILSELKELRNVSELLSTLEMAIGFLSTAGGDPKTKVCDYLKNLLLLGDGKSNLRSKKAQQSFCLCHILDLWSTIAEARAKFLFRNRQDPFEDISESFKEEMPRDTIALLSAALKRMDVDLFLRRVIEVISLRLVHEEERNRETGLSEYLSRVFYDSSDLDETPDQVKVMHIIHTCELALDVREKDQGRKRSMMS